MTDDLVIVGAGIAGLSTAIAARRTGRSVTVVERAPQLNETGAGLQIAANGSRVLEALGLAPQLQEDAVEVEGKNIRLWSNGQSWKLFDLGVRSRELYGAPYWMLHRADLQSALLTTAHELGVTIELGVEATGYRLLSRGASLQTTRGALEAREVVIGADGIHSAVRAQMVGRDQPRFTGVTAWRGLAPLQALPESLRANVGTNWVGPGRHVITYPVRRHQLLNFVGIVERSGWTSESWSQVGDKKQLEQDFAGWHPDVQAVIAALEQPLIWALAAREPLTRCYDGAVVLIGDACHPTLPFLAQGANMALEDAYVLVRCLDHYRDATSAFAAFASMRLTRTAKIVQQSAAQAQRFHNPAYVDAQAAATHISAEWQPEKVHERYDWLFRYDALTAPLPEREEEQHA